MTKATAPADWMLNGDLYYWHGPDERWYVAAGWRPVHIATCDRNDVPKGVALRIVLSPRHYLTVLDERRME